MNGEITGKEMVLKSKRKWFWVGMAVALFLPPMPGFIFGFSLLTEKSYRREALIIICWTIIWAAFMFWLGQYILGARLITPPSIVAI
ncbi:MAG: hypothetical protein Q7S08_00350 [bacterium]|nr:hypothetical protein [bacterium]